MDFSMLTNPNKAIQDARKKKAEQLKSRSDNKPGQISPPQEEGLEEAGFLPFDADDYMHPKGLVSKVGRIKKIIKSMSAKDSYEKVRQAKRQARMAKRKMDKEAQIEKDANKLTANEALGTTIKDHTVPMGIDTKDPIRVGGLQGMKKRKTQGEN